MNPKIEVLEISEGVFSALTPLLEKKKADKALRNVEAYLRIVGHRGFQSSWAETKKWSEVKEDYSWYTEFSFRFPEPQPGLKKAIEFTLNQALKE